MSPKTRDENACPFPNSDRQAQASTAEVTMDEGDADAGADDAFEFGDLSDQEENIDIDDDLDALGMGDQTGTVGESGDVAPSPPPAIDPYADMDGVWEEDEEDYKRILAEEEAERKRFQEMSDEEASEDKDEETRSRFEEEEDRKEDGNSFAGSDADGEEESPRSSSLSPAPESDGELPRAQALRALDDSDDDPDYESDEEEGEGTTLEREPWLPADPQYGRDYIKQMRHWDHEGKMNTAGEVTTNVLNKFARPDGTIGATPNPGRGELIDEPNRLILPFAKLPATKIRAAKPRPLPVASNPNSLKRAMADNAETPVFIKGTGLFSSYNKDQLLNHTLNAYAECRRQEIEMPFVSVTDEDALAAALEECRRERKDDEKRARADMKPGTYEKKRAEAQAKADAFAAREEAVLRPIAPAPKPKGPTASSEEHGEPVASGVRRSARRVLVKSAAPAAPKHGRAPPKTRGKVVEKKPTPENKETKTEGSENSMLRLRCHSSVTVVKGSGAQGEESQTKGSRKLRLRGHSVSAEDKWAQSLRNSSETANDAAITAAIQEDIAQMDEENVAQNGDEDAVAEDALDDEEMNEQTPSEDESEEEDVKTLHPNRNIGTGRLELMWPAWQLRQHAELGAMRPFLFYVTYIDRDGEGCAVIYPPHFQDKIDFDDATEINTLNEWRAQAISSIQADEKPSGVDYKFASYPFPSRIRRKLQANTPQCVFVYPESDENLRHKKDELHPPVLFITSYDQEGKIRSIVYPMLSLKWNGRIELDDINWTRKSKKWRAQWVSRKSVSKRFGRNNDDEWSLKESDWVIKFIACILYAHRHQPNVFSRIIWELVEMTFDAYFAAEANHQIRRPGVQIPLAQTSLDDAPWKPFEPGVQFDRRQQLPSSRIGGIMTREQIEKRATLLFDSHIRNRVVTASEMAEEKTWGRFVRPLDNSVKPPKLKKNECLDGLGDIFIYIKRKKDAKVKLAKKRGEKEDGDDVGLPGAGGDDKKTTKTKRAAVKKSPAKGKAKTPTKKGKQTQTSAAKNSQDDEDGGAVAPKTTRKRKASSSSPPNATKRQTLTRAPSLETIPEEEEPAENDDGGDEEADAAIIRLRALQSARASAKEGNIALNSAPASAAASAANAAAPPSVLRKILPKPAPAKKSTPGKSPKKSPPKKGGKENEM